MIYLYMHKELKKIMYLKGFIREMIIENHIHHGEYISGYMFRKEFTIVFYDVTTGVRVV